MLKKILLYTSAFLLFISPVYADTSTLPDKAASDLGLDNFHPDQYLPIFRFGGLVDLIIGILVSVVILFFLFKIIQSGITIIGSGSDAQKKQGAFKSIINAFIGLILVFLSVAITTFILSFFGVTSSGSLLPDCNKVSDKATCIKNASKLFRNGEYEKDCKTVGGQMSGGICS